MCPAPALGLRGRKEKERIPGLREPTNFQSSINFTQDRPPNNNIDDHRILNLNYALCLSKHFHRLLDSLFLKISYYLNSGFQEVFLFCFVLFCF